MVGKIKRARHKLHHGAVKVETESCSSQKLEKAPVSVRVQDLRTAVQPAAQPEPQPDKPGSTLSSQNLKAFNFPKGIFASTKITPETLVQSLKVEEPSPVQPTKQAIQEQKGGEEKKQQSKKEKMKERRQRWMNKISAIKVAREQQVALERRKATPVVGDMRVLADALPELTQLLPSVRASSTASVQRKQKGLNKALMRKQLGSRLSSPMPHQRAFIRNRIREQNSRHELKNSRHRLCGQIRREHLVSLVKKKAEPTDYYQMKPAQKRKLLEEETSRFSETLKDSTFKANPLAAIGEHLRKRLRQEDEQS